MTLVVAAAASTNEGFGSKSPTEMANLKARHFKTKREMAAKKLQLQSWGSLRSFKPSFMEQSVECDYYNEETCYDENYDAVSCARYEDGGCPCPEGQQKCGADETYTGYCATLCCGDYEEACYGDDGNAESCAAIANGGCPCSEGEQKCGGDGEYWSGYCAAVCCDDVYSEETCYNDSGVAISCAPYEEGGCPCPEGQQKCGEDYPYFFGYCSTSTVCCDYLTEETCYDDSGVASSCAPISEGCPCPEGQEKCGGDEYYAGYCTTLCCNKNEETCYGEDGNAESCVAIADGGCPCPEGQVKCGASTTLGYEYPGYCTEICCDATEELCYSDADSWYPRPTSCAKIADGGCPCPEGQVKCGSSEYYAGYCTALCCDSDSETCYDENWDADSCAPISEGGCPCAEGEVKCGANTTAGYEYAGWCTSLCCENRRVMIITLGSQLRVPRTTRLAQLSLCMISRSLRFLP